MTVGTVEAILTLRDEMSQKLAGVQGKMDNFASGVKSAIGVAAASFAAMDIAGTANKAVAQAGEIADAAQRIGVSAEAVQRLGFAASQSGSSLDTVAVAIGQMSKELSGSGDAISALGLNLDTIKNLAPDQAFLAITDAIRQMPDPIAQTNAAMEIFGRGGTQLLPAIREGFREIGAAAPVMSDALVASGNTAGDKIDELRQRMDNLKAQALLPLIDGFLALGPGVTTAAAGIAAFLPNMQTIVLAIIGAGGPVAAFTALKVAAMAVATFLSGAMTSAVSALLPFLGPGAAIIVGLTAIYLAWKHWDKIVPIVKGVYDAVKMWLVDKFTAIVDNIKGKIDAVTGFFSGMYDKVVGRSFVPDMIDGIATQFGRLGEVMVSPTQNATGKVQGLFAGLGATLKDKLGPTVMSALTGGGSVMNSVSGLIGGQLSKGISEKFGSSIAGAFGSSGIGKALGSTLGSFLPGIGTLIGPLISKGLGAIGKLFGFGGEGKEVKKLRGQFEEAAGGAVALKAAAAEAGVSLAALYSTKKVKDFKAAAEDVQAKLKEFANEQAADAQRLSEAIKTYGFTFEELGPKLQQQNLHERATELIEDWRVLAAAGINIATINSRMGASVSEYLQTAINVGAEIPAAMRPILQSMIDQGTLVDANGVAITNLASTGVTFSETMTQGFDKIVKKLDELITKLQGAGAAIGSIPRSVDVAVNYSIPDLSSMTTSNPFEMPVPSFASGTGGQFLDFGSGTPAMLHGREKVVTAGEESGGMSAAILRELGALQQVLPMAIRDAILLTR